MPLSDAPTLTFEACVAALAARFGADAITARVPERMAAGTNATSDSPVTSPIVGVCIDSRRCTPGVLFVALKGQVTDGHRFVEEAVNAGAAAVVAQNDEERSIRHVAVPHVLVPNTLDALHAIAEDRLRTVAGTARRIGITGSNGKTTTKELIAAVCAAAGPTAANPGNLNSETGVPLAAFAVSPGVAYAVFEMGMNNPGEIAPLARIVRPDVAVITNIGTAHVGRLGSRDAIAAEKKAITTYFDGSQTLVVHEDDEYRPFLSQDVRGRVVEFGPRAQGARVEVQGEGSRIVTAAGECAVPLPGYHNALNALAALRVAELISIPFATAAAAIGGARTLDGRGRVLHGARTVLADWYNANRDSMVAAIAAARRLAAERSAPLVLVLGEMGELGWFAERAHREVLEASYAAGFNVLCTIGAGFAGAETGQAGTYGAGRCVHAADADEAARILPELLQPGQVVLVKGSRAVALETLEELLVGKEGSAGDA